MMPMRYPGKPQPRETEPRGPRQEGEAGYQDQSNTTTGGRGGNRVMSMDMWLQKNPGKTEDDYYEFLSWFEGRNADAPNVFKPDAEGVDRDYFGEQRPGSGATMGASQQYGGGDTQQTAGALRRDIKQQSRTLLTQKLV